MNNQDPQSADYAIILTLAIEYNDHDNSAIMIARLFFIENCNRQSTN
jgi:hypothetical protein